MAILFKKENKQLNYISFPTLQNFFLRQLNPLLIYPQNTVSLTKTLEVCLVLDIKGRQQVLCKTPFPYLLVAFGQRMNAQETPQETPLFKECH